MVRPYRPDDRDAVDDICIRTADSGRDASDFYEDPGILPAIFAHPYAHLEPDLAFVVDDGGRAVGYILGTADTPTFVRRFRDEWLPLVTGRFPPPADPSAPPANNDEAMAGLLHNPERMLVAELAPYPAHLHIDLLPPYQRAGHGRRLVEAFVAALRERGVPGLHLGMAAGNVAARRFYDRLGFHEIAVADAGPVTYLGLQL